MVPFIQEPKLLRVCIDDRKADNQAILKGKVPGGVCLRDISELRLGYEAFNFKNVASSRKDFDCCFSIIGTERTLCMIAPTKVIPEVMPMLCLYVTSFAGTVFS